MRAFLYINNILIKLLKKSILIFHWNVISLMFDVTIDQERILFYIVWKWLLNSIKDFHNYYLEQK